MNVKEFKAWLLRNIGSGGQRPKGDEFNKALKGSERAPKAPEYYSTDVPEYQHYAENQDLRKDNDDDQEEEKQQQQQEQSSQSQANASSNVTSQMAGNAAKSIARNIVPKLVLVGAGSVVVVNSYNEIKAHQQVAPPAPTPSLITSWDWDAENGTATLKVYDDQWNLLKEVPATVKADEHPATCTTSGYINYSGSATYEGQEYTDLFVVNLPALGHALDDGIKTIEDGEYILTQECTRCHEIFVVTVPPEDIDFSHPDYDPKWSWNEDHSDCTIELYDHDGHLFKTDAADTTLTQIDATCTTEGKKTYSASYIQGWDTYTVTVEEAIPMLAHSYGDWTTTVEPTCTEPGEKEQICSVCGDKHTEAIPASGHSYGEDWTIDVAPTCTKEGSKSHHCDVCGSKADVTVIPAKGHSLDEGTKSIIDGKHCITYECTECHEKFTIVVDPEEIDPTIPKYTANWTWSADHTSCDIELLDDDSQVVKSDHATVTLVSTTDPTCTKVGKKVYKATYTEGWDTYTTTETVETPANGHTLDDGTKSIIDGKPAITYECTTCHDKFTVITSAEED